MNELSFVDQYHEAIDYLLRDEIPIPCVRLLLDKGLEFAEYD